VHTVYAYAQNLSTLLLEPAVGQPERGDLVGSYAGEGEEVEGEDHRLLPSELAQGDLFPRVGGEGEVRSPLSYLYHEDTSQVC